MCFSFYVRNKILQLDMRRVTFESTSFIDGLLYCNSIPIQSETNFMVAWNSNNQNLGIWILVVGIPRYNISIKKKQS